MHLSPPPFAAERPRDVKGINSPRGPDYQPFHNIADLDALFSTFAAEHKSFVRENTPAVDAASLDYRGPRCYNTVEANWSFADRDAILEG